MKTKLTTSFLLAACTLSASQIVGTTVNSVGGFLGIFPYGPDSLTIQRGTNDYQTVTAYEVSFRPFLPSNFEFPELELMTLSEAATSGELSLQSGALANYELDAALSEVPGNGEDIQKDMWNIDEAGVFVQTPGMIADLSAAESLLSANLVDFANFAVFTAINHDRTVPEFIAEVVPSDPPASAPEPASLFMLGFSMVLFAWGRILLRRRDSR